MLEPPPISPVFERQSIRPLPYRNDEGPDTRDTVSLPLLQSAHMAEPYKRLQVREGAQQSDVPQYESRFENYLAK